MSQDRASGAAGREYGLRTGAAIAALLGAEKLSKNSNEIKWKSQNAVIKACDAKNNSIGVTAKMLNCLTDIYGAFENHRGDFEIWHISPEKFKESMRLSPSAANRGADTRLVRKSFIVENGTLIAEYTAAQVQTQVLTQVREI